MSFMPPHLPSAVFALVLLTAPLIAQTSGAQNAKAMPPVVGAIDSRGDWPQARTDEVDSIVHILDALYGTISGPAGEPRDWRRFRSLFVPGARLMPVRVVPGSPDPSTRPATDVLFLSLDDYITRYQAATATLGFFEHPIQNQIEEFGGIAHVFSTYEPACSDRPDTLYPRYQLDPAAA